MASEQDPANRKRGIGHTMGNNDSPAKLPRMTDQTVSSPGLNRSTLIEPVQNGQGQQIPITGLRLPTANESVQGPVRNGQSPQIQADVPVSSMTAHDLNKMMWHNLMQMNQMFTANMYQSMRTLIPEMVKQTVADIQKDVCDVKNEQSCLNSDFQKLKEENEQMKTALSEHQRFLSLLDSERRSANVIVMGVPEDKPLISESGTAENDNAKVAKILHEIDCYVTFSKAERLGQKSEEEGRHRPIKLTLNDADSRGDVLSNAKKLKTLGEAFSTIYIKKDLSYETRKEMTRLREVFKREKEKPENIGKNVFFNYRNMKVYVNDVIIDRCRDRPF